MANAKLRKFAQVDDVGLMTLTFILLLFRAEGTLRRGSFYATKLSGGGR